MSSELQERIAEALFCKDTEQRGWQNSFYSDIAPEAKDEWRALALVTLKAMREPSPGMIEAAAAWLRDPERRTSTLYRAMIDHEIKLAEGGNDE